MFLKKYANLYRFRSYFAKHRALLALLLFCMLLGSSLGVCLSYLSSRQLVAISNVELNAMIKWTSLIIGTVLVHHIAWFMWDKLAAIIASRVAADIRRDIFDSTLLMRYSAIRAYSAGYYLERLNDDAAEISCFVQDVTGALIDMFTNVSFLVIIFLQNWQCALLFTLGVVGLYLIDLHKIRVELRYTEEIKRLNEALSSSMTETIRGIRDIKGLGVRGEVVRRSERISAELAKKQARMKSDVTFWDRVRTFGHWVIDAAIVYMCAFWLLPSGQITAMVILLLFNYKGLMYDTISCVSKVKGYYVQGDFKAGRILEILDNPEKERFGGKSVHAGCAAMEVRGLSFAYGGQSVLRDVSFRLAPCTASVLLGPSGGGKSTLFGLLTRLYDADCGQILMDGIDIREMDEQSMRAQIGIVNQEPFLFSDTILSNLRIVRPDAGDEEIYAACRQAGVHEEILAMKDGYATVLDDNGGNLSGGQKQRLSIARAILKDTPVILFDEPTSALDRENQAHVLDAIAGLKKNKTVFVIAHKLGDLSVFDQVLLLQDGTVRPAAASGAQA